MDDLLERVKTDEAEIESIGDAIQEMRQRRREIQERLSESRIALEVREAMGRIAERHGRAVRAQVLSPEGADVAQEVIAPGAE